MWTTILDAAVEFHHRPFIKPLLLSSGTITEITEARARVTVRVNGVEATGFGSVYISDLWAWPQSSLPHEQRDAMLRRYTLQIAQHLFEWCGGEAVHPLELGLRLHYKLCQQDGTEDSILPVLARVMCGSPFDAAIHDAVGQALNCSAFSFYEEATPLPGADPVLNGNAATAIKRIIKKPRHKLAAWLVVGANDSFTDDVAPMVRQRGYFCFKLKLLGRDNAVDVARTIEVFRAAKSFGIAQPRLSVDSNEANPDAASVLDYLQRLQATDTVAFTALEYLEQPTSRDILTHPNNWRSVTKLKPVLLDEGLSSLERLDDAIAQGWSGLALKTCKGHSFALVAAAWAHQHGLLLSLQDLTNPGLAAVHSALFAAYVTTINGVEINSPQYTPAANASWLPRLNGLFAPRRGAHRLDFIPVAGLGSNIK